MSDHVEYPLRVDSISSSLSSTDTTSTIAQRCNAGPSTDNFCPTQSTEINSAIISSTDLPEKLGHTHITSQASSGTGSNFGAQAGTNLASWRPSLLRILPLSGLAALVFALLQIFASYALLQGSNGQPVASWKYSPNVYLAILTAISNKALAFAIVQGTVVTFWQRALNGTTLAQLHRDWSFGLHVYKALLAGRHFSFLALGCIFATFVAIDGPLLQRASTVIAVVPDSNVTLSVSISPELPSYRTGTADMQSLSIMDFNPDFMPVVRSYAAGEKLRDGVSGCHGSCSATIHAPALAVDFCRSELTYTNYSRSLTPAETKAIYAGESIPDDLRTFAITFTIGNGTREYIEFNTTIVNSPQNSSCAAYVNLTSCHLVSAIGEYTIAITNRTVNLAEPHPYPQIVARANNTAITNKSVTKNGLFDKASGLTKSTLAGLANTANYEFRVNSGYVKIPATDSMAYVTTTAASMNLFGLQHLYAPPQPDICIASYTDPRDQIMAALNDLMVRSGFYFAQLYDDTHLTNLLDDGLEINSKVTAKPLSTINVFDSNFRFFAGAATVELSTILVILITFYGYWSLGREVSFSPLEIAKAFEAPLLHHAESNQNGRAIARDMGERRVRYGVLRDEVEANVMNQYRGTEQLTIADETRIDRPSGRLLSLGEHFDLVRSIIPRRTRRGNKDEIHRQESV